MRSRSIIIVVVSQLSTDTHSHTHTHAAVHPISTDTAHISTASWSLLRVQARSYTLSVRGGEGEGALKMQDWHTTDAQRGKCHTFYRLVSVTH